MFNKDKDMSKPKLIIVEGPDCCGKSTLAKAIARSLNATYWHITNTPLLAPATVDYMTNGLANAKANLNLGRHVVFDRFWPSEVCYGPVLRPDTNAVENGSILQELTRHLDPIYIFCKDVDGVGTAIARHNKNKNADHPYRDEVYGQIYLNYLQLRVMLGDNVQVMSYYFDQNRFDEGKRTVCENQLNAILTTFHLYLS